jgi:glutamate N-acetyltransferase/amino-acid N-acetyltransferase
MAIGRSGAKVNVEQTALWLQTPQIQVQLVDHGQPLPFDAATLSKQLQAAVDVTIVANLGTGSAAATYWTCDMSYKYVEINAEYTT